MLLINHRFKTILLTIFCILLIPLVAMQFSTEINWSLFDFLVGGILLLLLGSAVEIMLRKIKKPKLRLLFLSVILFVFFLLRAELAVGIFGTPFAGS